VPIAESALQQNVTEMVAAHGSVPPFEEGYREWRRAFYAGQGGVFRVPVAEVVTFIEQAVSRGSPYGG
jgi:hypothetical protein